MLNRYMVGDWLVTPDPKDVFAGIDFTVKVGCPPGTTLFFDQQLSLKALASRGQVATFECPYEKEDSLPCISTSGVDCFCDCMFAMYFFNKCRLSIHVKDVKNLVLNEQWLCYCLLKIFLQPLNK